MLLVAVSAAFARGHYEYDRDGFVEIPGLRGFSGVTNTTGADVVVTLGGEYSVRARAESDVLDRLEFDVRDDELRIRQPWRPWSVFTLARDRDARIEVTMPDLESVRLTGGGDLVVEGAIDARSLTLRTTGAGSIEAYGNAGRLDISATGGGDITFDGECESATFLLTGLANLFTDLRANSIDARITGSGDIEISGSANRLDLVLTGPGDFGGNMFDVQTASITITGSGNAFLAVERSLEARLTGAGDVVLTDGDPAVDARTTGMGRVVGR